MGVRQPGEFKFESCLGAHRGYKPRYKFGKALDCDAGVPTDVWDGADGTTGTLIWAAPTVARIHDLASTDAADDGAPVGTGMRTVRVYGLIDWDTEQVFEDVILNGTTDVPTTRDYVIIHRMKGITFGVGATNAGIVTATAQTDATVTAAIQAGNGQTLMAILGVPSPQSYLLTGWARSVLATVASATADVSLLVNERPHESDSGFLTKDVAKAGSATVCDPPVRYAGPALLKIQAESTAANAQVTAHFNGYLAVDNQYPNVGIGTDGKPN